MVLPDYNSDSGMTLNEINFSQLHHEYSSLTQVLSSELNKDNKLIRLTFDLPERRIEVYSIGDTIKSVIDTNSKFCVKSRIDWSSKHPEQKELLEALSTDEDIWNYPNFSELLSDMKDELKEYYYNHSLLYSTILDKNLRVSAEKIVIYKEEIVNKGLFEEVSKWDYFNLTPGSLNSVMKEEMRRIAKSADELLIDTIPWFIINLLPGDPNTIKNNDLDRFLSSIATERSSLQDVVDKGNGFSLADLLESIKSGVDSGLWLVDSTSTSDDIDNSNIWSLDDLDSVPEDMQFDDFDDLDIDDEEDIDDGSQRFMPTPFLTVSIEKDIREIMDKHIYNATNKFKLFELLLQNTNLEADVREIEGELKTVTKKYLKDVEIFDSMRMNKSLDAMSYDEDDEDESNLESTESDRDLMNKKQEINSSFFTIEKLEKKRFLANEDRKNVLNDLILVVPEKEDDLTTNVHEILHNKLKGIDEVKNIAYFPSPSEVKERSKKQEKVEEKVPSKGLSFKNIKINLDNNQENRG